MPERLPGQRPRTLVLGAISTLELVSNSRSGASCEQPAVGPGSRSHWRHETSDVRDVPWTSHVRKVGDRCSPLALASPPLLLFSSLSLRLWPRLARSARAVFPSGARP